MAATPEKFEKVVITKAYLDQLERSQTRLVNLLTPIKHLEPRITRKIEKTYAFRPSGLSGLSRSEIEAAKLVIIGSTPNINTSPDRFEPYAPPSDHPDVKRLEEKVQELEEAAAELKKIREWLGRHASRFASALVSVTQSNIQGLGLGSVAVTADLAFLEYLNELKIKK